MLASMSGLDFTKDICTRECVLLLRAYCEESHFNIMYSVKNVD